MPRGAMVKHDVHKKDGESAGEASSQRSRSPRCSPKAQGGRGQPCIDPCGRSASEPAAASVCTEAGLQRGGSGRRSVGALSRTSCAPQGQLQKMMEAKLRIYIEQNVPTFVGGMVNTMTQDI